ncbi:phospholipase effector Tle1 domain-containing protein [Streptomyces rectiviolaceus]|uniref:phospholipase effector Tle1 domain-containing protein n=1 Tax=Streptomyces rectiviolaceus TaxID=332591 RepID=UPI003625A55F
MWHQQPGAAEKGQELKQVWFAGVHTDVGGGYPEKGLSDITLLWMIRQAHRYGLRFGPREGEPSEMPPKPSIFLVPPEPDSMGAKHNSRKGFYRLVPRLHRPIGKSANKQGLLDGYEYLSQTAKDRYDNDASYRPRKGPRRLHDYLTQDEVNLEPVPLTVPDALLPHLNAWTVEQTQAGGPGSPATGAVVHEDGCELAPPGGPELDLGQALAALARPGGRACQDCAAAEVLGRL